MAFRPLTFTLLCALVLSPLGAAGLSTDKLNGLLNNSPFGASRANAVAGTGTGDPLEFRAVLEEGGKQFYSIYDTAAKRSTWVELNDPVNGFSVKGYDVAHDSVTVDFHGKTMSLAIKRAPAVAQAGPSPGPGSGPGPNSQVGPGGPAMIDQQRLQQVQEEIRRRRALRQQTPGGAQATPTGPPQIPVNPGEVSMGPQLIQANGQSGPQLIPGSNPGSVTSSGPQPSPAKP